MGQEVYASVLAYEKVKTYLEKHPEDKAEILKCVDEIKGDYRFSVVRWASRALEKTFMRLYDGVNLELPEGFSVEELQKKYHLILVPNHQSHADYIALQYIFHNQFKVPIYIAAGINLNIFPIGTLFKRAGAFFIRRKFTCEKYKLAFQGYIYYLLKSDKIVEFFFEGGRTRTGKLLPPKYGLFSMILDAHTKFEDKKPLMFIPVSIAHEMIPEEGAYAKEANGAKKEKEKTTQLLKLFTLFNKKLGTVHARVGEGIIVNEVNNLKEDTQNLAFRLFRAVGKGIPVTPSSLLSLIMLDNPSGALTWKQIEARSKEIVDYCQFMNIPVTKSLKGNQLLSSVKIAMDMFINNKKARLIKREKLNQVFYTVNQEGRTHLLYHKNMILHHFLVPCIMNATWFKIFSGDIKTAHELTKYLLKKRIELKYEFYLPKVENMLKESLKVIQYSTGEKLNSIDESLKFNTDKLYKVAEKVRPFSSALTYIYEANYVGMITIKYLQGERFGLDKFLSMAQELSEMEMEHGRVVKYPESFSVLKLKDSIGYFESMGVVEKDDKSLYSVVNIDKVNQLIEKYARDVNDQVTVNLKFNFE